MSQMGWQGWGGMGVRVEKGGMQKGMYVNEDGWVERGWVPTCTEFFNGFHGLWDKIFHQDWFLPLFCPICHRSPNPTSQTDHDTTICDSQSIPGSSHLTQTALLERKWPLTPDFAPNFRKLSETWSRCWEETQGEFFEEGGWGTKGGRSRKMRTWLK